MYDGDVTSLQCNLFEDDDDLSVQWDTLYEPPLTCRQVSNIRRTKSQHSQDSRTVLRLSLPNPLKPDVKSRMKM